MKKLLFLLLFVGTLQAQQTYTVNGSWTLNTEPDISHYEVLRGPSGGSYSLVVSVPHPGNTFTETGLSGPNCWVLVAVNSAGIQSVPTAEACVGVPGTPGGFSITITVTIP